jgi:hypothetical protein
MRASDLALKQRISCEFSNIGRAPYHWAWSENDPASKSQNSGPGVRYTLWGIGPLHQRKPGEYVYGTTRPHKVLVLARKLSECESSARTIMGYLSALPGLNATLFFGILIPPLQNESPRACTVLEPPSVYVFLSVRVTLSLPAYSRLPISII